jgi:hypothetical protein
MPEEKVEKAVPPVEEDSPGTSEKVGNAVGRALGLAGGMLIGSAVGSFFLPGVGTIFFAGVLGAALFGTGGASLGAAAGNTLDEKVVAHIQHEELHIFEDALRQGRTIIIALTNDEEQGEAVRASLSDAGAASLVEARESWWNGLRVLEAEEYARAGQDFANDEVLFRRGFEAAQHRKWRGKSFMQVTAELRERYGEDAQHAAFKRGYQRGLAHHQQVMRSYQSQPNQE